ncbi:hypothetical protein, partial [Enterococcus faecium]
ALNTVRNSRIESFERAGVLVNGAGNTVINNTIGGGTVAATTMDAGGIVVDGTNADFTRIVSNVIARSATDGIRISDA